MQLRIAIEKFRTLGPLDIILAFVLICLTIALLGAVLASLQWEGFWDSLYFHHIAYLIFKKGMVPYRDLFDVNMFGVYVFHGAIGALFGYGDLGLRIADIAWLSATCVSAYFIMRRFGWQPAWFSSILFGWIYINQDDMQTLQREYLMILPVACAVLIAISKSIFANRRWLRSVMIGMLFGIAAALKPNGIVCLPVVVVFESQLSIQPEQPFFCKGRVFSLLRASAWAALGTGIPLGFGLLWLWYVGGIAAFYEMITQYWPYYARVRLGLGVFHCLDAATISKIRYERVFHFHNFSTKQWLILPALFATWRCLRYNSMDREAKAVLWFVLSLMIVNYMQIVAMGHFHPYSWMPMLFYLLLLFSLCFFQCASQTQRLPELLLLFAGIIAVSLSCLQISPNLQAQLEGRRPVTLWSVRADEIAGFLKQNLTPSDQVQAFDLLGGTNRALLLAEANVATPIINDAFLFLCVKQPIVERLRRDFLDTLMARQPRFIITVTGDRLYATDPDDNGVYLLSVKAWLKSNYRVILRGNGYQIWECGPVPTMDTKPQKDEAKQ